MRAAKINVALYEEVEADKETLSQAITVVILSNVAPGFGAIGTIANAP